METFRFHNCVEARGSDDMRETCTINLTTVNQNALSRVSLLQKIINSPGCGDLDVGQSRGRRGNRRMF